MWVVRVGGNDEEPRPWRYIHAYSIESTLIIRVRYDCHMHLKETQSGCMTNARTPASWVLRVWGFGGLGVRGVGMCAGFGVLACERD